MLFQYLASCWDPCSSAVSRSGCSRSREAEHMESRPGTPARKAWKKALGRIKGLETLSAMFSTVPNTLVCELHIEGTEISWWRALVCIKLKCITRSDYDVLMLGECMLIAHAFTREGNKAIQQVHQPRALHQCWFLSQELVFARFKVWCSLNSSCGLFKEFEVGDQWPFLPVSSPKKSWMHSVKLLNL